MATPDEAPNTARVAVSEETDGALHVVLQGTLDAQTTGRCWRELEKQLRRRNARSVNVDASGLHFEGGIGIALVRYLSEGGMTPGAAVTVRGLGGNLQKLMETFTSDDFRACRPPVPFRVRVPEEIGAAVRSFFRELRDEAAFIGGITTGLFWAAAHPRRMRWLEIRRVMEKGGANALPVVSLFSALVGLVLVVEAAHPLRRVGAEIFIADVIGLSAVRDVGPLVTGILLAGRSGSAFAAELGTMKVNQELDAMQTMGLDPIRFLVLQRVVAAVLLTPLLTVYAIFMAVLGGMAVMSVLGFPPLMVYHQMATEIRLSDFAVGLIKAVVFGLIVGGVGCLRGMQTGEGARSVGVATTRAVVAGILLIILVNTVFSLAQYFLT